MRVVFLWRIMRDLRLLLRLGVRVAQLALPHPAPSSQTFMARGQRKACAEREERPARGGSNPSVSCTNCETVCGMQAGETSPPNPPIPSPGLAEARMGGDTNRWGGRAAGLRWRALAGSPAGSCVPPHVGAVSPSPGWRLDSRHQKRHCCSFDLPEDAHALRHATCRRCHSWGTTFACKRRVVDDQTARPCPPRQPVRRQLSLRQPFPGWSELLPGLFVCLRPVTGSSLAGLCIWTCLAHKLARTQTDTGGCGLRDVLRVCLRGVFCGVHVSSIDHIVSNVARVCQL